MTCTACERSKAEPTNDRHWAAHCMSCKARALASVGLHADALDKGTVVDSDYRNTLERLFGQAWERGDALVRQWHGRISRARAKAR